MLIADYFKQFPDRKVWCAREDVPPYMLEQGMFEFTEDSACSWAGPFNKLWAYYSVQNGLLLEHYPNYRLQTIVEVKEQARLSRLCFPFRFQLTERSVMSEHKVQDMLSKMTKEEIKYYEKYVEECCEDRYTADRPYRLYMCGNDDCSYSKFYPTLEELREELGILNACQPLEMTDIYDLGFVSTN